MEDGFWKGLALGWFLGAMLMWGYFTFNHLIRSRSEWYADRKARGYSVPDDWQEDYPNNV